MDNRKYYLKAFLMAALVTPVTLTLAGMAAGYMLTLCAGFVNTVLNSSALFVIITGITSFFLAAAITLAPFLLLWRRFCIKEKMPDSWSKRLAPIMASCILYIGLWVIAFGISGYSFDASAWEVFFYLTLPYIVPNFLFAFSGDFTFFPIMLLVVTALSTVVFVAICRKKQPKASIGKSVSIPVSAIIALCLIAGFQHHEKSINLLGYDQDVEYVEDEVNLNDYRPFSAKENLLKKLDTSFIIDSDYPRLDGATAAYPVYSAVAQGIYVGLDENTVSEYVSCTKTNRAFERLISDEIDVFFGVWPSPQQMEMADEMGLELELIPIAKEAFVFFVNAENPVGELSLEQIQDIYTKKITNWRKLGGKNEKIMPFQRPENSGSQTVMLANVMRDISLPEPLREEYATGMGGIINQVASYRNYASSIGYSFRFFATGMKPNDNIKLLAINGVEPSIENIRNDTYPFTVEVYAITARPKSRNTQTLLWWLTSEDGQSFIELCGYVGRWN